MKEQNKNDKGIKKKEKLKLKKIKIKIIKIVRLTS
jgi:hypothetical protein